MRIFSIVMACCLLFCFSCTHKKDVQSAASPQVQPSAVLKAGKYPLWFQLAPGGPVHINSMEDAYNSRPLIPWPLAEHISFILAHNDVLYMAVNRDGFLAFNAQGIPPDADGHGIGMYWFTGGAQWELYTVAAFVFHGDAPAALLYRDDHFLDSAAPPPDPRVWTFSMQVAALAAHEVPAFAGFPASAGWDIDALHSGADGLWYYRAVKKGGTGNEMVYLRTQDLDSAGEHINLGDFQNSALPAPLSQAPEAAHSLFAAMDAYAVLTKNAAVTAPGAIMLVSPDSASQRYFARDADSIVNTFAYVQNSPPAALAINARGQGLFTREATGAEATGKKGTPGKTIPGYSPLTLPELPENFFYTGVALTGDVVIAGWEEQKDYSIGAAGFMVQRLPKK